MAASFSRAAAAQKVRTCLVCFEAAHPLHALVPCGHFGFCAGCAQRVARPPAGHAAAACPVCRGSVRGTMAVYAA